jgi:outer membrane protein assembly factor BamD
VICKYPTSEYATSAKAKLEGARDQLPARIDVGRYYLISATSPRPSIASDRGHRVRPRAMSRKAVPSHRGHMAIGIVGEAQTAAAVLDTTFLTAAGEGRL